MKRINAIVPVLLIVLIFAASAYADYDQSAVKAVMKTNIATMSTLKKALNESDFSGAAQAFNTFASNMKPLSQMTPPKGSKADWNAVINEFVAVAQSGAKSSGERNLDKAKKALDDLQALMKKGHGEFK